MTVANEAHAGRIAGIGGSRRRAQAAVLAAAGVLPLRAS